ncbi:MAG: patatin family protein [Solobacterium sp.]|nr:patatin family protein [Solobacterium sp.]
MEKYGLVLEGGGLRGAYSVGVLAWLNDQNIEFDYSAGISSGAMYLACYELKRPDIGYRLAVDYAVSDEVIGIKALLKEGHYVAYRHLVEDDLLGKEHFDAARLRELDPDMEVGVYDLDQGKTVFYPAREIDDKLTLLRAACALPIASAIVDFKGHPCLDGGVTKMIPIERALEQGCTRCMIITTKPEGYVRKPAPGILKMMMKNLYAQCPQIYEDYCVRHENYYKQMDLIDSLVDEGKAVLMRPTRTIEVSRFKGDPVKCRELYELGYQDAERRRGEILAFLNRQ